MHGAILRGYLDPDDGGLDLADGSGSTGNGELLGFVRKEAGHVSHGHACQMIIETGVDVLCESGGWCSCKKESKKCTRCILWTWDVVIEGGSWEGVNVREGCAVGGVNVL